MVHPSASSRRPSCIIALPSEVMRIFGGATKVQFRERATLPCASKKKRPPPERNATTVFSWTLVAPYSLAMAGREGWSVTPVSLTVTRASG